MSTDTVHSDKELGLSIVLGAVALAGAGAMVVGHDSALAGYGFAVAMVAGALLVSVLHVYE